MKKAVHLAATQGTGVFDLNASDVQLLKDIKEMMPEGVDPREAVRFYLAAQGQLSDCGLAEGAKEYLQSLQLRKLSYDHQYHVGRALERLTAVLGADAVLGGITDQELTLFFSRLPFALRTLANYHQYIRSFFGWTVKRGYCPRSPMDSLEKINVPEQEPEFMPAEEVQQFFAACLKVRPVAAPFFALSFFAGFRSTFLRRLRREDVKFSQQGIVLPGAAHKTGRRFYVEGFEPNLWEWLEPWRNLTALPSFGSSTLIKWREDVYTAAGVHYPHNGGRHSFCTYHVALCGDANKTATLLTHRGNVSVLYNHYRGNATRVEAEKYFDIRP